MSQLTIVNVGGYSLKISREEGKLRVSTPKKIYLLPDDREDFEQLLVRLEGKGKYVRKIVDTFSDETPDYIDVQKKYDASIEGRVTKLADHLRK